MNAMAIFPIACISNPFVDLTFCALFGTARDYGLNHIRFHSWCPPKAAFEVADEMEFYLQVELPLWAKCRRRQTDC